MQVRAILNLSQQIENQNAIVECGTIPELVQLTKTGSQKAMEIAAAGLSELASGAIAERERNKAVALGLDVDSLKRLGNVGFSESSGVTPSMSHTAAFRVLDTQATGSITVEVLKAALWPKLEADGSAPKVSSEDVLNWKPKVSSEDVQQLIDMVDENGDGELQLGEFEKFWKSLQARIGVEIEISPAAALSAEALEGGEEEEGRSSDRLVLIAEAGGARDRDPPPPIFHLSSTCRCMSSRNRAL